jgi:drug/metabolite transporter (DMT)-like permease
VWCIGKSDSNRVAVYNNLTPVFSVICGVIFLKESFTYIQFVGAVIIFIGLYISTYRKLLMRNNKKVS